MRPPGSGAERFRWAQVINAYETFWIDQDQHRRKALSRRLQPENVPEVPSLYPPPEISFRGYPTKWLDDAAIVVATSDGAAVLPSLLSHPLTNYAAARRFADETTISETFGSTASMHFAETLQKLNPERCGGNEGRYRRWLGC